MGKIQEYQTRTSASSATPQVGHVPTQFNVAGYADQAIKGAAGVADILLQRASQEDVSDLNIAFAQANATFTNDLAEEAKKNGKIDTEAVMQKYADAMDSQVRSKVSTPAGQAVYKHLYGSQYAELTVSTMKLSQALAGEDAVQKKTAATNLRSNTLVNNPSGFRAMIAENSAASQAMVETGTLSANDKLKYDRMDHEQFVKDEFKGWAIKNPAYGKQLLDSGVRDQFFGKDGKDQAYGEIQQGVRAKDLELERIEKKKEKALDKQRELTQNKLLDEFQKGDLSPTDILKLNLTSDQKIHMMSIYKRTLDDKKSANEDAHFNDFYRRIFLPDGDPNQINDVDFLRKDAAKANGLTLDGLRKLTKELEDEDNPQGKMIKALKGQMDKEAKATLNPKGGNMFMLPDPEGERKMANWYSWYFPEYAKRIEAGDTPAELLTPGKEGYPNPKYLGVKISDFASASPTEKMRAMLDKVKGASSSGLLISGNIDLTNRPQVKNADGTISTLSSVVHGFTDRGRKEYVLLPSISDDGRVLSKEEQIADYKSSGRHLGKFKSIESAEKYSQELHLEQEKMLKYPKKEGETPILYKYRLDREQDATPATFHKPQETPAQWLKRIEREGK